MDRNPQPTDAASADSARSIRIEEDLAKMKSQVREAEKDFNIRHSVCDVIDHFHAVIGGEKGLSTGFQELDKLTSGLKPGEVFVIASQPGMGKTSLMLNMVEHICFEKKVPTLIFSGQMTAFQATQRLLFSRAKLSPHEIYQECSFTKGDLQRLQVAALEIPRAELYIDDRAGLEISVLRERALRYRNENQVEFIAIDDFRLMKSNSQRVGQDAEHELAEVSAGIKALARELGVPILVLADSNRRQNSKTGVKDRWISRMADLSDLRAIGQNADQVGLLHREWSDEAWLVLAKNRTWKTGWIRLYFMENMMRFDSAHKDPYGRRGSCP